MRFRLAIAGALALGLLAPAAMADDPHESTTQDVRCLIVAYTLAGSQDASAKQLGTAALIYYLGRVDGRTPDLDLEAKVRQEMPNVTPDMFMSELQRCGATLKTRGDALKTIGDHLKAAPATPPPAP